MVLLNVYYALRLFLQGALLEAETEICGWIAISKMSTAEVSFHFVFSVNIINSCKNNGSFLSFEELKLFVFIHTDLILKL